MAYVLWVCNEECGKHKTLFLENKIGYTAAVVVFIYSVE